MLWRNLMDTEIVHGSTANENRIKCTTKYTYAEEEGSRYVATVPTVLTFFADKSLSPKDARATLIDLNARNSISFIIGISHQ